MLGKLLKHELRATAATMLPILGVMLLISALSNVSFRLMDRKDLPSGLQIIVIFIIAAFAIGLMAVGLVTVFAMVRRFRDNLLRDEGYIMHTLPVSVHAQIWSKVLVSTLWYALAGVTAVLSMLVASWDVNTVQMLRELLSDLLEISLDARDVEILAEALTLLILGSLLVSLSFDAALSVGHSFARRKMAMSTLIFIAFLILGEVIGVALSNVYQRFVEMPAYQAAPFMTVWRETCAFASAVMLIYGAACYAITVFFLKHKLNLE